MFHIQEELRKPGRKRVILDTDTYNEIDDQFALALAMLSPDEIELVAVTAAPFHNENSESYADGMERSYREIGICTKFVQESHGCVIPPYYRGSTERMPDVDTPVPSEAVEAIYRHVMESDEITYIAAIGAITNVSSAILIHPELKDKIAVIWLGGGARWFGAQEFNLSGDVNAANALYKSGVPLLQLPAAGVTSHLIVTIHELEYFLRGNSPLGDYLCDNVANCKPKNALSWSRVIWDISAICTIIDPNCVRVSVQPRPFVDENGRYNFGVYEGEFEHAEAMNRDYVFSLLFRRLRK